MPDTHKLYRLQLLDSQADRVRARLAEIDIAMNQDAVLKAAQEALQQAEGELEARRKELRQAEASVADQRIKIEQTEASLYGGRVRSPKELQDLQNEAASLKRYRSVLEDRQLEIMLVVEEAEALQVAARSELERAQAQHTQKTQELAVEQAALQKDAARIETERQSVLGGVMPEDLSLYDQLRRTRKGVAVARVTNKACAACGSVLNTVLLQASRNPSQISRCTSCGRILYGG